MMVPGSLLLPAIVVVVLGLGTTILTAWGLAAWLPRDGLLRRRNVISQPAASGSGRKATPLYITVHQYSRPGMVRLAWKPGLLGQTQLDMDLSKVSSIALKLPTVRQDRSWGRLPRVLEGDFATVAAGGEDARGWPFLALWCHLDETAPTGHSVRGGIALSPGMVTTGAARVLPYLPIWRGLGLNTLIYAAGWVVAIGAFRWVRAGVRRWRGLCPGCGYDRSGGSGACPECGRGATDMEGSGISTVQS